MALLFAVTGNQTNYCSHHYNAVTVTGDKKAACYYHEIYNGVRW